MAELFEEQAMRILGVSMPFCISLLVGFLCGWASFLILPRGFWGSLDKEAVAAECGDVKDKEGAGEQDQKAERDLHGEQINWRNVINEVSARKRSSCNSIPREGENESSPSAPSGVNEAKVSEMAKGMGSSGNGALSGVRGVVHNSNSNNNVGETSAFSSASPQNLNHVADASHIPTRRRTGSHQSIGGGSVKSISSETESLSSTRRLDVTADEAADILDRKIVYDLSPAENAVGMLQELLKTHPNLSKDECVALIYSIEVLQSDVNDANVPFVLQSTFEEEDKAEEEINDWLRQDFSGISARPDKKKNSMSFQALTKGVIFALRMQKLKKSEETSPKDGWAYETSIPFECEESQAAEIVGCLEGAEQWGWDVLPLTRATGNRPLQTLGWHLLHSMGFVEQFLLDPATLRRWLAYVEGQYTDACYHNSSHATDVLASVYFMIKAGADKYLSEIEQLALLLAAMVHDMGHDGMSNAFHKSAVTQRALDHNDQSIQENYHASLLFRRMATDNSVNIFGHLSKVHFTQIRSILIHCLLHTDMSQHFTNLKEFKNMIEAKNDAPEEWVDHTGTLMASILHTADIGAQAKPQDVAMYWGKACMQEFWKQGDREKELGLPISPQCNRESANVPGAQVGFIKFIVIPTFEVLGDLLPKVASATMPHLDSNLQYWQSIDPALQDRELSLSGRKLSAYHSGRPDPLDKSKGGFASPKPVLSGSFRSTRRQSWIHKNVLKAVGDVEKGQRRQRSGSMHYEELLRRSVGRDIDANRRASCSDNPARQPWGDNNPSRYSWGDHHGALSAGLSPFSIGGSGLPGTPENDGPESPLIDSVHVRTKTPSTIQSCRNFSDSSSKTLTDPIFMADEQDNWHSGSISFDIPRRISETNFEDDLGCGFRASDDMRSQS